MIPTRAIRTTSASYDSAAYRYARGELFDGCRRYVAPPHNGNPGNGGAADAERMLAGLRWLDHRLQRFRSAGISIAADADAGSPPTRPSLGACCRQLVEWVQEHPERANEPLEWVIRDMLKQGAPATVRARAR